MSRTLWKSLPAGPDTFHRHCGVSVRASAAVLTSKLKGHSAGEMKMGKQTTDVTKAAALYMLKNGLASYKEIAQLSGRSPQIIRIWGGKVDWPGARKRYLQRAWTRASQSRR